MLSAFYEAVTGRAPDMLRAYLLAVLVQMVALTALAGPANFRVAPPLFFGAASALGGLAFGIGMTLAVGCAGAVLYRAGEGKYGHLAATVAYALGVWAGNDWVAAPMRRLLGGLGRPVSLHETVWMERWLLVALLAVAGLLWLLRAPRRVYQGGWDWGRTGLGVGVIGAVAWAGTSALGRPSGLGTFHGSDSLATLLVERNRVALDWSLFLLVGIPVGSWIASRRHRTSPGQTFRPERLPRAVIGGALMGLGAAVSAGDNLVHGLGGVPLLAAGSMVFMLAMFVGVWVGVRLGWLG